jgi:helix-turn-helix protein
VVTSEYGPMKNATLGIRPSNPEHIRVQIERTMKTLGTQHAGRLSGEILTVKKSLLHTLIQVVGYESAEKIIAEFGGTRIWVPARSTPDAKLTRILGDSAASALCARFGGEYLQIPNTITGENIYRRIAELHRQGCKINDIALAVGRSRRTVFRLLRRKITDSHRTGGLATDW